MPLPRILVDFADDLKRRFGDEAAGHTDDGAFVVLGETAVHVFLDRNAGRAVAWTELEPPERVGADALARAAVGYTQRHYFERGLAVGFDRDRDLLLIGHSFDQQALVDDSAMEIVSEILMEAPVASRRLAETARAFAEGRPPATH